MAAFAMKFRETRGEEIAEQTRDNDIALSGIDMRNSVFAPQTVQPA